MKLAQKVTALLALVLSSQGSVLQRQLKYSWESHHEQ